MRSDEVLKKAEEGIKQCNQILIRELVRDLEEKGISPVIAVDGEVKELKIAHASEIKDFERELTQFGLKKSDFCLLEENTAKLTKQGSNPIIGNIILIHKKSAKLKKYDKSHWVSDFHRDLKENFFC
jgi:hypothetical protein